MTIASELNTLRNTKTAIKQAIIDKGVNVKDTDSFDIYAQRIGEISSGTTPTGTIEITENGTYDVTNYASANVNVEGGLSKEDIAIINSIIWESENN